MTERLISLSVSTKGAEDYFGTFQDLSELAGNLTKSHDYVNVSCCVVNELELAPEPEELYYDDQTLVKVRTALMEAGSPYGIHEENVITDFINAMQNAGILFRERAK